MTWQLSNLSATLDIAEDDAGITQVRDHLVLEVFEQQAAGAFAPDTRDESSSVTFYVGGTSITLNPLGSGKFYCVADNLVPAAPYPVIVGVKTPVFCLIPFGVGHQERYVDYIQSWFSCRVVIK